MQTYFYFSTKTQRKIRRGNLNRDTIFKELQLTGRHAEFIQGLQQEVYTAGQEVSHNTEEEILTSNQVALWQCGGELSMSA